eukprot:Amastigsp_a842633_145.p5 type:complete len:124 gc:universal Amastigsp_a842633_145:1266-1637(+)
MRPRVVFGRQWYMMEVSRPCLRRWHLGLDLAHTRRLRAVWPCDRRVGLWERESNVSWCRQRAARAVRPALRPPLSRDLRREEHRQRAARAKQPGRRPPLARDLCLTLDRYNSTGGLVKSCGPP